VDVGADTFEQFADLAERLGGGPRGAPEDVIAALPTWTVGVAPPGGGRAPPPPLPSGGDEATTAAGGGGVAAASSTAGPRPGEGPPAVADTAAAAASAASPSATGAPPDAPEAVPDTDGTCAVCLADFAVGEELRELRCGHAFHKTCIDTWLRVRAVCPVCKADLDGRPATGD